MNHNKNQSRQEAENRMVPKRFSSVIQFGLRWTARIWSALSVGMILTFLVGEGLDPTRVAAREWIGFLFFPVGVSAGLVLGWWKERWGGLVALGSLAAFYGVDYLFGHGFPRGWAFGIIAFPGLLFWICGRFFGRRGQTDSLAPKQPAGSDSTGQIQ